MKLPSINYLIEKSKESFLRFPLTILCSIFSVVIGIYLVEKGGDFEENIIYINIILTFLIGISIFFCVAIFSKKEKLSKPFSWGLKILATLILVCIYLSLPKEKTISIPYIRYAILIIVTHLFVSFAPYLWTLKQNGFWNYNKTLFLRICTSVLYSIILYAGLALAITTINVLFNVQLNEKLYFELYILMGLFNTWFFVSGIPKDFNSLEDLREYPKSLRVFAQYVLLPLLLMYLLILYTYSAKILVAWDWPKGIISYLVSCVSILGIFTFLLIYPYRKIAENSWIKKFTKYYYFIILPLIVVLFIAIGFRINDYGLTLNRFLLLLLGIWFSLVALYFIFFKANDIKFIPVSLAISLMLFLFGPWNIFKLSNSSQASRLTEILEEYTLIKNKKIVDEVVWERSDSSSLITVRPNTNSGKVNDSIYKEIKSILKYLKKYKGLSKVSKLFTQNIDSISVVMKKRNVDFNETKLYIETMGLDYSRVIVKKENKDYSSFSLKKNVLIPISSYQYMVEFPKSDYDNETISLPGLSFSIDHNDKEIVFKSKNDNLIFDLNIPVKNLNKKYTTSNYNITDPSELTMIQESSKVKIMILFKNINSYLEQGGKKKINSSGAIFIKIKK